MLNTCCEQLSFEVQYYPTLMNLHITGTLIYGYD